jgi:predicted GTPase
MKSFQPKNEKELIYLILIQNGDRDEGVDEDEIEEIQCTS